MLVLLPTQRPLISLTFFTCTAWASPPPSVDNGSQQRISSEMEKKKKKKSIRLIWTDVYRDDVKQAGIVSTGSPVVLARVGMEGFNAKKSRLFTASLQTRRKSVDEREQNAAGWR